MATQLSLYRGAARELGQRSLTSLTDTAPIRYALDEIYTAALKYCLEQGYWNFAIRSVQIDNDAGVDPPFGYSYAFDKPDDWVRTAGLSADDSFHTPLEDYIEEAGYWYAYTDPLYVRYVSNDSLWGLDIANYPESYTLYVETYLAIRVARQLGASKQEVDDLSRLLSRRAADAKSKDAMNEGPRRLPRGKLVRSRAGSRLNDFRRY